MRGTDNRLPILAAIFMALLFAAIPGTAEAQLSFGGAAPAAATNCGGMTGVQLCQCQMSNAHMQRAQSKSVSLLKIYSNANNPSMRLMYCWNTIQTIFQSIGAITSSNMLVSLFWGLVMAVLNSLINQVCAAVIGAIESAINMIKNLVCIPIPHFSLNLSSAFKGGSCNGISLFTLLGVGAIRPTTPANWQIWNYSPPAGAP